jgi:hypothetical protein
MNRNTDPIRMRLFYPTDTFSTFGKVNHGTSLLTYISNTTYLYFTLCHCDFTVYSVLTAGIIPPYPSGGACRKSSSFNAKFVMAVTL